METVNRPEVICMCGSTKFADLMAAISWEFEKTGRIVLHVNYVPEWYVKNEGWTESSHGAEQSGLKKQLDELHCRKIDICDKVFVCNFDNYIGESTRAEIEYAKKIGKPVSYLSVGYPCDIDSTVQKVIEWWLTELRNDWTKAEITE